MTDIASLAVKIDSTQTLEAAKNLEAMRAAGKRVEDATNSLAAAQAKAKALNATYNTLLKEGVIDQERFNAAVLRTKAGLSSVEAEYRKAINEVRKLQQAQERATASIGQQRAGMQQLSYQIGDVAQQFALGTNPMIIFAQQGGQVVQALQLMRGTAGGFIGFLAGPWGAAIMGGAMILGTLAAAHLGAADASDEHAKAGRELREAMDDLHAATVRNTQSTYAQIQADIDAANAKRLLAQEARKALIVDLQAEKAKLRQNTAQAGRFAGDGSGGTGARAGSAFLAGQNEREIGNIDRAIGILEKSIDGQESEVRLQRSKQIQMEVAAAHDASAAAALKYDKALDKLTAQVRTGTISEAAYRAELSKITATRNAEQEAARKSNQKKKESLSEEEKAYKKQYESTERFIESLELEIAKIGLDEKALRQLQIARELDAAKTDAQRAKIKQLNDERERGLAAEAAKKVEAAHDKRIIALEDELSIMGLVGAVREKHLVLMEKEQFLLDHAAVGIERANEMWEEYLQLRLEGIDTKSTLERDALAAEALKDSIAQLASELDRMGGLGSIFGGALGFLNGGNLGGPLGAILGTFTGTRDVLDKDGRKTGEVIARTLGDELRDVFAETGTFGTTLKSILGGAGIGIIGGQMVFGNQGVGGQAGSAIGGVLGKKAGELIGKGIIDAGAKGLTKLFGQFAGPLGAIAGGIIGGLVGGLVKKNKTGKATISGSGVSLSGNSSSRKAAAGDMAGSVQDALDQIADALGADLDMALGKVTVAVRNKSLRVDPTGGGNTKTSKGAIDFGQDQEAAIKYAISDLISDGVLTGISEGMKKLLNSGNDLEKQLQKALDFKGVFDWLEQQADPTAYALKQLGKELDYLNGVFVEAGATAEEMAKLEEYSSKRRLEIMEEANRKAEELLNERLGMEVTILGLQGKATEALALARQLERNALDETLRPLLDQTYALQDAAAYREMEIQLMEALGQSEAALAARRQQTLAATVDSLKPLQMAIWAAQDAAEASAKAQEEYTSKLSDARSVLISAYNREASALQTTADRFRGFADTLREFRADLYGADSGLSSTRTLLVNLMKVGAQAAAGNETGLQALPGAGRDYLAALKNTAGSAVEYQRGVAMVARYADQGASAATGRATSAEAGIALLHAQVSKLVDLDEGTVSLNEAMSAVKDLLANPVAPAEPTPVALPDDFVSQSYDGQREQTDALHKIERTQSERLERLSGQVEKQNAIIATMASNIASMAGVIKGAQRSGNTLAMVDETP